MVDLLVYDDYRDTRMCLLSRPSSREITASLLVTTEDGCSKLLLIDFDILFRIYLAAAPRTASQLGG
jgi:hypothetical protein